MENTRQNKHAAPQKKPFPLFKVLVVVLMVAIIALLLLQRCTKDDSGAALEASVKAKLGQLDGKSEAEIQAELNRVIGEGMFHISINTDPGFDNGAAEGNLEIENVPNNLYDMRVEITLDEDGSMVYDSGLIQPNYHVQKDNLKTNLAKGDYPALATFYAYEGQTLIGSAACRITIHILN